MSRIIIRRAKPSDRADVLRAVVELQNYERQLHETRLPGEQIADAYTDAEQRRGGRLGARGRRARKFRGFCSWLDRAPGESGRDRRFEPIWIHLGYLRPLDLSRQANRKPAS